MRIGILLLFIVFLCQSVLAQDAEYSQFYANPLYLNPAFTGTTEHPRFIANYRNQWPSMGNTFVNYSISYDQYSKFLNGGFGLQLISDKEAGGMLSSSSGSVFYSHHIKINNHNNHRKKIQTIIKLSLGMIQR